VANTQSAKKQVRSSYRKWLRNRYVKGKMRGALQMVNKAIADGDVEQALALMPSAASQLDKAARKNVIHHRKAARLKSRLMHKINALQAK
jgi:small subunit ribosomal protein S20